MGVVYAPALGVLYSAAEGKAWKEEAGQTTRIHVLDARPPLVVVSRSHADNDPELKEYLNAADLAAHDVIMQGLKTISPDLPVLSEEDPPAWAIRQQWQRYWLVDPLDGTKEFIKRNGEFTVNIARQTGGALPARL
ncbi:hypothetical protein CRX72_05730 [Pantoea sp. BRM17]|nr:hypothetical protein CRX72_05730 [Pantoea sp. BRM17]